MTDQSALVPINPQQIATIPLEHAIAQTVDRWLESQNCEDSADTKPQNRLLSDLIRELPLARGSIYQLIKELGIDTIMAPDPNNRGRVAWLTPDDCERLRDVAQKVANKEIKIADASIIADANSNLQPAKARNRAGAQLAIQAPPELLERLRAAATAQRRTATAVVVEAIEAALSGERPEAAPADAELLERLCAVEAALARWEQPANLAAQSDDPIAEPGSGTTSKRQGWKAATFYLRPETLAQLRRVVMERKLEGATGDLSDAVEEALQAWLNILESPTDVALHGIDKPSEIDMNERKIRFSVDLPVTIHGKLWDIANQKQCKMTDVTRSVLFDWTRRNVI
jgi:predicted DNA-binding protein